MASLMNTFGGISPQKTESSSLKTSKTSCDELAELIYKHALLAVIRFTQYLKANITSLNMKPMDCYNTAAVKDESNQYYRIVLHIR